MREALSSVRPHHPGIIPGPGHPPSRLSTTLGLLTCYNFHLSRGRPQDLRLLEDEAAGFMCPRDTKCAVPNTTGKGWLWPHLPRRRQDRVQPTAIGSVAPGPVAWAAGVPGRMRLVQVKARPQGPPDSQFCRDSPLHLASPCFSDPHGVYHFNKTHPTSLGEFFPAGQYGSRGKAGAPRGCVLVPGVCSGTERA